MNGVAIGPDSQKNIDALKKADWLVVGEIYPDETSEFWKSPGHHSRGNEDHPHDGLSPALRGFRRKRRLDDQLGALAAMEERSRSASGGCRLDQDIVAQIFLKVRELYQKEGGKFPDPILNLTWPYTNAQHPSLGEMAKEMNGKALAELTDPKTQADHQDGSAVARIRLAER